MYSLIPSLSPASPPPVPLKLINTFVPSGLIATPWAWCFLLSIPTAPDLQSFRAPEVSASAC